MKLLFFLLPLFGCALGFALESPPDNCVATCPPPNCSGNALEACTCLNQREYACQAKCPDYKPRILHCPRLPVSKTTKVSLPESTPTQCVCEEVFCILSFPEGCYCQNDAKKACFEKCGGEEPIYQDCSIPVDAVKARAPEPEPVPEPVPAPVPAPQAETCECEDVICILSFPEGCYCRNNAKKACFEKCGGEEPTYQDCSVDVEPRAPEPAPAPVPEPATCVCDPVACREDYPGGCICEYNAKKACSDKCGGPAPPPLNCPPIGIEARSPKPEPVPEPLPEAEAEACVCPAVFCPQVWPQSCWCAYNGEVACAEKCGKPAPVSTCPPIDIEAREPEPEPVPAALAPPKCECPLVNCIQSWPESCYCQNAAKERCYKQCGGKKPTLQVCPPQTSATLTTSTKYNSTPVGPREPTPTNQICGGGRGGALQECPAGQTCITDPFKPGSCGPACDQLGICVSEKLCGGFAGFECDIPGQICVDDPRDDCDPLNGGSDCGGLCAWPQ